MLACLSCPAAGATWEGKVVRAIEFQPPEQPYPRERMLELLTLKQGEPATETAVRASISALYATGRFEDISILADEVPDGLRLIVRTDIAYFIGQVSVTAVAEPPSTASLEAAAKLRLGERFDEAGIPDAVENIKASLRANGYYDATVSSEIRKTREAARADIHFNIDPGERARFGGLTVTGNTDRGVPSLLRDTGWLRGIGPLSFSVFGFRDFTQQRLQQGIESLRQELQGDDRLLAKVQLDKLNYEDEANRMIPALKIDVGPRVQVETTGASIRRGRLKQLLPIYQERSIDPTLLNEGRRNLVQYFRSQGYFDATADYRIETPSNGEQVIEYVIDRGQRSKLTHLEVNGNRYFDDQTIRERMAILPATRFRFRNGRFSERLLEGDLNAIENLYRSNGFREVKVEARRDTSWQGNPGQLAVFLDIEEGPQWLVSQLDIAGLPPADEEEIRPMLRSTEGQPFSEWNVQADRDMVLNYYFDRGYPEAAFDWDRQPGGEHDVRLSFTIRPGDRQYVREVQVLGLEATDPGLVSERISLRAGEPLSFSEIAASQRRLYDLGIFARVQTAVQNREGEEDRRVVLFDIEEAKKYSFSIGFGAELGRIGGGVASLENPAGRAGFSPRVNVGISRLNVLGLGHTISLLTRLSNVQQRGVLSYLAPQFRGNDKIDLIVSALYDRSLDVRTYAAQRIEASAQIGQRWTRAVTTQYRATWRRVRVSDLAISPELIPIFSQPTRTGLLGFSFVQDRRDDPSNTRRGIYNTFDFSYAASWLGSQTAFVRSLFRNTTYHRLRRDLVIARSTQVGQIQRLSGDPFLPLPERFFTGGASSHRAFPENQAGPRDLTTGFQLGSQFIALNSVELRYPVVGNNLSGVLFWDSGNGYEDIRKFSLRFRQRDNRDFNYTVHGIGAGIRYRTPIGPVRFDLSYSPNSPRFFGYEGNFEDLITGQGRLVNQRINRLQFHFALGQTY
jgi:outer membrane protein insertion porin family